MFRKWLTIPLLILLSAVILSCDNESKDPGMVESQGYMSAMINGRSFHTTHVSIPITWSEGMAMEVFGIGENDEIGLWFRASPGTYILGHDDGQAGYYDKVSTDRFYWSVGYSTDGSTGGQITVSEIERNKKVVGSFSFTVKINGELISITNGSFSVRNVPKDKSKQLTY